MKPQLAILVFLLLVSSAVLTGIDSLCRTERRAQQAVDQALARTIELCEPDRIDTDTIQVYRSFITMNGVRDTAYLTLDMRGEERQLKLTARTGLTFAVLWALSDQRASGALSVVAVLWLLLSLFFKPVPGTRAEEQNSEIFRFDRPQQCFYAGGRAVHFTPMQQTLMELFWQAPGHRLSQQEICDRLWPKKPDASATLYTLIRRLKPVLRAETGMTIVCRRGDSYQLILNGEEV
ncbi:MAG: helix-turn-helix domain-containing protein [Bacteroidaceae bacterium]|nr:helix-turn-helix domain-containing protein [Bacteroidaceae bacterium]